MLCQKRRAVWRLAGDIRGEGAGILLQLWDVLGYPEDVSFSSGAVTRYGVSEISPCLLFVFFLTQVAIYRHTRPPSAPWSAKS